MPERQPETENNKILAHQLIYPALITILWIVACFIVDPRGEFPLNDDWAYSRNVRSIVVDGVFTVDHWPAMTLISQTFYGTLVTGIFGFSFTCLRISMLVLAWLSTLTLFFLFKRTNTAPMLAFVISIGFCFSLLYTTLAFSFMTDVFFASFCIFSFYQLHEYVKSGRLKHYVLYVIFCVIAVLDRQPGFLLALMIIMPELWKEKLSILKVTKSVLPLAICFYCHHTYYRILREEGIFINNGKLENISATWDQLTISETMLHAGRIVMEGGFILLPAGLIIWFTGHCFSRRWFVTFLAIVGILAAISVEGYQRFPMGNVLSPTGVGPMVLKDHWLSHKASYQISASLLSALKVLCFLTTCVLITTIISPGRKTPAPYTRQKGFFSSLQIFLVIYVLFCMINLTYIDRYILPFALVVLILVFGGRQTLSRSGRIAGTLIAGFAFAISVLCERDFMEWQRTRWRAVDFLHRKGIRPNRIDAGFEYGGLYRPGKGFYDDGRSWYWIDQDDFIVALAGRSGYNKIAAFTYKRKLPPVTDTIYVLERIGP